MFWFGQVQRMGENRIVCVILDMYTEWKKTELYVLVWACTENGRKWNCMCWFGHIQRMEVNRNLCVGLDTYREWKEIELYLLVSTCTENGRK